MKKFLFIIHYALFVFPLYATDVEYKDISADKINYNAKSGNMVTSGKTEIVGKTGQRVTLLDAYMSKQNAGGNDVIIQWNERTRIVADEFQKDGQITQADNMELTACYKCDPVGTAWTIHATDMTHYADEKNFYFRNFWFDMYGMPILYLPYVMYPDPTVKYRSGLLIPEFGSATNLGTQFNIPMYLNFSNNHDMTVWVSLFTEENPMLMIEHRLRLEHASFDTSGSVTRTKDLLNRWHLFHKDVIELGENARLRTMIQRSSDKTYLQQYGFYDDQPFLESNAQLELFAEKGYATVGANVFQELRQEVSPGQAIIPNGDILPKIHGAYQLGVADNLYARVTGDIMRISDFGEGWSVNRGIAEGRIIAPLELLWQRITLSAALRSDLYQYNDMPLAQAKEAARFLPSGYIDWEMPFVRTSNGFTQIIKPKARITVMGKSDSTDFLNMDSAGALLSDTTLFINNRYPGYDVWVNGTYADYGISFAGYDTDGRGVEIFVGQTFDFGTDNKFDINSGYHNGASDIVGRLGINPKHWFGITNRFRFGKDDASLRHLETELRIGTKNYMTFGYIWAVQFTPADDAYITEENISEGVIGAGLYFTDRLVFRAQGVYNFTHGVPQRYDVGIYYEHPCYNLGIVYIVDNAYKTYNADNELDFRGVSSFKLKFSIKMGQ